MSRPTTSSFANPLDFSDSESERVLRAAALAMASELGRQAADDIFNELYNLPKRQ